MSSKIKVAAVSYLNTKPLLYGIERGPIIKEIDLLLNYPSQLAKSLKEGEIDLALLPVAAIPGIPGARIVSSYGIAAEGNVASVAIFSKVPMTEITSVLMDYQSRTSVNLAALLLENYWNKNVEYRVADTDYISAIHGTTAGVIIGDRALQQLPNFEYVYDLSAAWKSYAGLDFVFAAWVANKDLPSDFLQEFDKANAIGQNHLDEIVAANPFPYYSLKKYYTENIKYYLDDKKKQGLNMFLDLIAKRVIV